MTGFSQYRVLFSPGLPSSLYREWNLVTYDCQWCPRSGHASFCFENSMYVVAGEGNDGQLKDVWRSQDGAHWMRSEV